MFKGQIIWITGASSGIGAALAQAFAAEGARLILSARRETALHEVKEQCVANGGDSRDLFVLPLDITDTAAMEDKVSAARAFGGRIDMLINNAGISQRSTCLETELQTYRTLFEVDVFGQIALTRAVLPIMVEQRSGHIAATASIAGKVGAPLRTGYCAAKHAVMGFFDSLRAEVTHLGIKVTTITPGFIRTPISENALSGDGTRFGRMDKFIAGGMDVTECAQVIMRGFHKGKPEIAVGKGIEMHALWVKKWFPGLLFKIAAGQYHKVVDSKTA
ncbi:SDR family oxidoreductase [Exilibacterium tricleocarpae]|uniref:SDR family oxidoreductase n=1 Tax=Exilibacterium tricleocarpae TaxID=2591008 RepID=A0A545SMD7_9GAMM|nr:SDR family oxidoreductase [Exilibacterium tricleocarpae]TQV66170.1 SDR family oxidoreductase [Exilibacterium tricleocarpae]